MKYLLFDRDAVSVLTGISGYQSIEYQLGHELVLHFCGKLKSTMYPNLAVKYTTDGVIFIGRKKDDTDINALKVYCVDLTTCELIKAEEDHPADLLTVMQKSFRTALKTWENRPFSFSERVNGTKSIIFPFTIPDKRRLVIERANDVKRFKTRGISFPLLAYKYSAEEPPHGEEFADTKVLQDAGEEYREIYFKTQQEFSQVNASKEDESINGHAIGNVSMGSSCVESGGFNYLNPIKQMELLTASQKRIVEYDDVKNPLRIEGAAGTGKTASLILRAYMLLKKHKESRSEFRIIFVSHSESTNTRCKDAFKCYPEASYYLSGEEMQSIQFTTLLSYCAEFAKIELTELIENNADDAKSYQLLIIEGIIENAIKNGKLKTYRPFMSTELQELFDSEITPRSVLVSMLQDEFSVQIKGRTDCIFDQYVELAPIPNGLPCKTEKDKQLVFSLFTEYQAELKQLRCYDVDDVTLEALARLNAPVWRRKRIDEGHDYIIVDEMHLFNINEQSIFHYLTRTDSEKDIPICFALDYCQAIGDRGDASADYIEKAFGERVEKSELKTVFRNSPYISDFCAAIAASGTLMFHAGFQNPYGETQSSFTAKEESKCEVPQLFMYENDDEMIGALEAHLDNMMRILHCKKSEIAVISFEQRFTRNEWVSKFNGKSSKKLRLLERGDRIQNDAFVLVSPYDVNGLEFAGVILLGVDDGRVPQKMGVSDISKHYIMYSAYNLLYLSASRAKYRLSILGSKVNGVSPCLEHTISNKYLQET